MIAARLGKSPDDAFDVNAIMAITGRSINTTKTDMEALCADGRAEPADGGWKSGPA